MGGFYGKGCCIMIKSDCEGWTVPKETVWPYYSKKVVGLGLHNTGNVDTHSYTICKCSTTITTQLLTSTPTYTVVYYGTEYE